MCEQYPLQVNCDLICVGDERSNNILEYDVGGKEKRGYRILKRSLAFNIWSLHSSDDQPYNDGSLKIECYTASLKPQNSGNFGSSVSRVLCETFLLLHCTCSHGNFDNRTFWSSLLTRQERRASHDTASPRSGGVFWWGRHTTLPGPQTCKTHPYVVT